MVSRSLARRALLLGIWASGILVLLELQEPGFWKDVVRVSDRAAQRIAREAHAPPARVAAAPARESVPEPARPAPAEERAERAERAAAPALAPPARTPSPAPQATPAAVHAAVASTPRRPADDVWARVDAAWRLDASGRYAEAWRIARTLPERGADVQILRLKALTAMWAGRSAEAIRLVHAWCARAPHDHEARLALAQAEVQEGDDAAARATLAALAREPLGPDDRLRLAALQDWAGDVQGALASADAVLAERPADPDALRRRAVLLERGGRAEDAREAVARARRVAPDDDALLLLDARLASRLGDRASADAGYAAYLERHPDDVDARLEAARHAVNAGQPELAVERYDAVARERGNAGLRVDLARALLAAGRYADAEDAARDAVASPEDGPEARLALAQSVYLQGRAREAARLFDDAQQAAAAQPVDATFHARLALARDRDVEAWGLLGDQIADEALPEPRTAASLGELLLLRGRVAEKRGDHGRARSLFEQAAEHGAALGAGVALDELERATRPVAGASYGFFADANRLQMNGGTVWTELRPSGGARLTVQALGQVVSQGDARFTRTGGRIVVDEFFPVPEWELHGGFGFVNSSAGGGDLVEGVLGARRFLADGSVVGLTGYREPLLGGHEDLDPRLWNRIIDLEALGPSFAINGGKLYADALLDEAARDRLWLQLGAENYEDGNLRGIFYAHYQLPVRSAPDDWTVIRPNAFVEAFKRSDVPTYFSPETHATLGIGGHTVQRRGRFRVEAEVNPQMLVTNGEAGFGVYGLLDASVQLGPATVGASGFAFYDSQDSYWLARAMARVEVEF